MHQKTNKKEKSQKISAIRVEFFSKIVKRTGSINCEQGGKNFKIVKRSCSLNRYYRVVFLLISNLTYGLRLHQFLRTRTTEANKSLKTDANGDH